MKAMILAAGLGTRLRPLTDNRPKALIEVAGHTLLEITLSRLRSFGISEVIVNVHHFAEMLVDYLNKNSNFGMRIEISREDVLLDTGGGLKKAAWFFLEGSGNEPFLLHNDLDAVPASQMLGQLFRQVNRAVLSAGAAKAHHQMFEPAALIGVHAGIDQQHHAGEKLMHALLLIQVVDHWSIFAS